MRKHVNIFVRLSQVSDARMAIIDLYLTENQCTINDKQCSFQSRGSQSIPHTPRKSLFNVRTTRKSNITFENEEV